MENPISGALPLQVTEDYESVMKNHDMFSKLQTDETVTWKEFKEFTPIDVITDDSTRFTFEFGDSEIPYYRDLSKMYLLMWSSITKTKKSDGKKYPVTLTDDNMAPIPYLPDSAFSGLDMWINGYKVTGNFDFRHVYVSLLKTLTSHKSSINSYMAAEDGRRNDGDDATGNSHLQSAGRYAGAEEATVAPVVTNVSVLTHGLSGITEKMPPKVTVRIVLTKANSDSLLLGGPSAVNKTLALDTDEYTYNFEIKRLSLLVRHYQMLDRVLEHDRKQFERHAARFYFYRPLSRWVTVPAGTNFCNPILFHEADLVGKCWIVFFRPDRLSGQVTKSISYFERPSELESIQITIGVSTFSVPLYICISDDVCSIFTYRENHVTAFRPCMPKIWTMEI